MGARLRGESRQVKPCASRKRFELTDAGRRCVALTFGLSLLVQTANGMPAEEFGPAELERIASHGPWPPAWSPDPGNRASGNSAAIRLGHDLFFEPRLSANGRVACATCHQAGAASRTAAPRRAAWQPAHATRRAVQRAPPALVRLGRRPRQPLVGQPAPHPRSAGNGRKRGAHALAYCVAMPPWPATTPRPSANRPRPTTRHFLVNLAKAIAAWQETLVSPPTAFDRFRDALARGNAAAAAAYPAAAQRGQPKRPVM
jgi:cytochrome c peroxidase